MAVPVWAVGQVLTASDVNTWLVDQVAVKGTATHYNGTAYANDPELVLPVAANAAYRFYCYLHYDGGPMGSSDLNVEWAVPSGATYSLHADGYNAGNVDLAGNTYQNGTGIVFGTSGAGVLRGATMTGILTVSSTSGNLQLQARQNTADATDTIIHVQSYLRLTRAA